MTRRSPGPTSSAASRSSIPKLLSDPVVRREDGSWLYLLPSVIDDVDLGVTHIVRGEDHVSNSAAQIQMFEALGADAARTSRTRRCWSPPRASCRSGWVRTASSMLRAEGVEPMALLSRAGADRHVAAGRAGRIARRARRATSTSRPSAGRRRISTRTRSSWSMRGCSTRSISRRSPTGCPTARPRRTGCCSAPTSSGWPISPAGSRCCTATSTPPELGHDERLLVKEAAAVAETLDWSDEPWRALTDAAEGTHRQEGPRAVPPAAPGADRPRSGPEMAGLARRDGQGPRRRAGSTPPPPLGRPDVSENFLLRNKCNDVTLRSSVCDEGGSNACLRRQPPGPAGRRSVIPTPCCLIVAAHVAVIAVRDEREDGAACSESSIRRSRSTSR